MNYKNEASDARFFTQALESVFGQTVHDLNVANEYNRLYSKIWLLNVVKNNGFEKIVAKYWSDNSAFFMQLKSLEKAREVFEDVSYIHIPYLGHDADNNIIFMEFVDDQTLSDLFHLSYDNLGKWRLVKWRDSIYEACFTAGRWLNYWHSIDKSSGRIDLLLKEYIRNRQELLVSIDKNTESRLNRMISQTGTGRVNAIHGDFTPFNVMWSGQRLTVFDFGISEWSVMSPWWDAICMDIGVRRELEFSFLSLGKLNPKIIDGAVEQFWSGYSNTEKNSVARHVCIALRHLVLYKADIVRGRKFYKRAKWHYNGFANALDSAENC